MLCSVWSEFFRCSEMTLAEKAAAFAECGFAASELPDKDGARLLAEHASAADAASPARASGISTPSAENMVICTKVSA